MINYEKIVYNLKSLIINQTFTEMLQYLNVYNISKAHVKIFEHLLRYSLFYSIFGPFFLTCFNFEHKRPTRILLFFQKINEQQE